MNFYNEHDKNAAAWLRELIKVGAIPEGVVDERDIRDIQPSELSGFTQCHFFAGIGGWSEALRLAGWPEDKPVWTGSCPCQPFSAAGRKRGTKDERHLWPAFFNLIKECRPPYVIGEQVASALGWIDIVQDDMEGEDYAFWAVDLCAPGVGAPHIRQRLYFFGRLENAWSDGRGEGAAYKEGREGGAAFTDNGSGTRVLADNELERCEIECEARLHERREGTSSGESIEGERDWSRGNDAVGCGEARKPGTIGMGDSSIDGVGEHVRELSRDETEHEVRTTNSNHAPFAAGATSGFWADCEWVSCADGKARPIKCGTQPLVDGTAERMVRGGDPGAPIDADNTPEARVMRLRGYGNSIVVPLAAEFIKAVIGD